MGHRDNGRAAHPLGEPRFLGSIRTRLIVAVLLMVALALAIAGLTAYTLQRTLAEQRAVESLNHVAEEFRVLATTGVDPRTGTTFASPRDLLRVAIQRTVLTGAEGELGIVGDTITWWAPGTVSFRPEGDPAFVAAVMPAARAEQITTGRIRTALHDHRYIVIPVHFSQTGASGALVRTVDLNVEFAALNATYQIYLLVALGSLVVVGLITRLVLGRMLLPLSWVRRTAEEINESDLSRRVPARGDDELTALTQTINRMLDRLERAFTGHRQLLDDVGHELRTPMTIIRGHLELMDHRDPVEVDSTRALAIDELDRMGRLVDDLITLAKAERADFVRREPVDVGRLTDETLERARALGERTWVLEGLADVEANLDPQRVTQAWLQLAANAVRYSAEKSSVGLGSRIVGDELQLWVHDEGIGIPPEDQAMVLTRFGRARHAEATEEEGAGLGLAIVNSIAQTHGGHLTLESTPGLGSTFTIVLPQRSKGSAQRWQER